MVEGQSVEWHIEEEAGEEVQRHAEVLEGEEEEVKHHTE